jgi:hypothetical protein
VPTPNQAMTELKTFQAPLNFDNPLMKFRIAHIADFLYSTFDGKLPSNRCSTLRWGAESMRHLAPSRLPPFAQLPTQLVLPVRRVSAVPSFPSARRLAAACAPGRRSRPGAPVEAVEFVAASRGPASACFGGHGPVVSFGRPLLLGRPARVALVRRVPSSPRRGRRSASADSCATGVACGGGGFVSRFRSAPSPLAPARIPPALPVTRSAPTPPSTGRAAIKPRRAGYVER